MPNQWRSLTLIPLASLALACPSEDITPSATQSAAILTSQITDTPSPSLSHTPTATFSASPSASASATASPSGSPSITPTASPTQATTSTASSTPAPTPTQAPTPTPELACVDRVIAAYPFEDDPEGTTAADTSAFGHDLTLLGGASFTQSRSEDAGQALLLNGTTARAQVSDSPALDLDTAVSIEAWIYLESLPPADPGPNWWTIATKGSAVSIGTERNYSLYIRSDGLVNWSLSRPDQSAQGECRYGNTALEAKRWYHIVVTASPEDGGTKAIYIDGALDYEDTQCENTSLVTNDGPFIVGDSDEPNHDFKGQIDSLTLRGCALSAGEVAGLYQP